MDRTKKISVSGDNSWLDSYKFEIKEEGGVRKLVGKSLPNHLTGNFPVESSDPAYNFDRNPNQIKPRTLKYTLPLNPVLSTSASCLPMGAIGVMNSGAVLFNALDGEGKDAVANEIQDKCQGHPEITGQYYYHGPSECIADKNQGGHSELLGYAFDGFGIYGKYGDKGQILTNKDLDECHGTIDEVNWNNAKVKVYHYVLTDEYPYSLGCFKGASVV